MVTHTLANVLALPGFDYESSEQVRELLAAQTQKRKPLTDVELQAAIRQTSMQQQANCGYPSFKNLMNLARAIARAIERAHGIGDTNEN